jgi:hypothetical protein
VVLPDHPWDKEGCGVDDTIIFMEHDFEKAVNMKLFLCIFEQLSGLKINFHKSEIFCFGKAEKEEHVYRRFVCCGSGSLSLRYLGVPIHHRRLKNMERNLVESCFKVKLVAGKENYFVWR